MDPQMCPKNSQMCFILSTYWLSMCLVLGPLGCGGEKQPCPHQPDPFVVLCSNAESVLRNNLWSRLPTG